MTRPAAPLLTVEDLVVDYQTETSTVRAVDGVTFEVHPGETVALVGESGSGKSATLMACLRLLDSSARVAGTVSLADVDVLNASPSELRRLRGGSVGVVLQDPMNSLNPAMTVGRQIDEALRAHGGGSRASRTARVVELLGRVGIPDPAVRSEMFPHSFSGGMRQRIAIAIAIANRARIILADEPTTALDVTVQAQVLDLFRTLQREEGVAIVMVTHDFGVVAEMADRVLVMRRGRIVESGTRDEVLGAPSHEYTRELLRSIPRVDRILGVRPAERQLDVAAVGESPADEDACRADGLVKHFIDPRGRTIHAVCGIDLHVSPGEVLCIVGESGSGKSTVLRMLAGLTKPTSGEVAIGARRAGLSAAELRRAQAVQMVFQDPAGSLNPLHSVRSIVAEPLKLQRTFAKLGGLNYVEGLLAHVGLDPAVGRRRPARLSGGQQQRVAIARALAPSPALVLLDEPVSALDVSVQSRILATLRMSASESDAAYVMVTHDLAVVRQVADRVAVMYAGRVIEQGTADQILSSPRHPYTHALLSAAPAPDPGVQRRERIVLDGDPPNPVAPASGCRFRERCWKATDICGEVRPPLQQEEGSTRLVACHHPMESATATT